MTLLRRRAFSTSLAALSQRGGDVFGHTRPLVSLAIPLIVSTGCFALTLFVDRTLLLWFDPEAAAAALAAGQIYWTAACLPVMAIGYLSTIVAQAEGGSRPRTIGPAVWQAVWCTVAVVPLCLGGALLADDLFKMLGHEPALAAAEARYFRWLMLVAPGAMLEAGLSAYFVGRGQTRTVMAANIAATVLNLALDAVLIFGLLGFPKLGLVGAAIATAAAMWLKVGWYGGAILWDLRRLGDRFAVSCWRPSRRLLTELLGGGGTLGLQQMLRSAAISGVLVAIGQVGSDELAASSLVMSLLQLVTIPLVGLGTAVTVMSGQKFALTGRPQSCRSIVASSLLVGLGVMLPIAAWAVLAPDMIVGRFSAGPGRAEILALLPTVRPLMALGAGLLLLEVLSQMTAAALRGIGAVRLLLVTTCVASAAVFAIAPFCDRSLMPLWSLLLVWTGIQAVGCLVGLQVLPGSSPASLPLPAVAERPADASQTPQRKRA